jgi:hypothetical protein
LTRNRFDEKTASDRLRLAVVMAAQRSRCAFVYFRSTVDRAGDGAIYRGISTQ